jgi:hypothetical protein
MLNRIVIAMFAIALMTSVCGAAFAADKAADAAAKPAAAAKLTKQQLKDIKMACKKEHKDDKAGYKACVKDKKKAAQ